MNEESLRKKFGFTDDQADDFLSLCKAMNSAIREVFMEQVKPLAEQQGIEDWRLVYQGKHKVTLSEKDQDELHSRVKEVLPEHINKVTKGFVGDVSHMFNNSLTYVGQRRLLNSHMLDTVRPYAEYKTLEQ